MLDLEYIQKLKQEFDSLCPGRQSLLTIIDDAEIAENVYNSNAIENSTLTLKQTEQILLDIDLSSELSLREVYEAKNLARVVGYIKSKSKEQILNQEMILLLHKMLLSGIDDKIAGRFRQPGEYVRVANHIAAAPEQVEKLLSNALTNYNNIDKNFIQKIAKFHLEFEHIHPFCDGNGRIGRVIINYQLNQIGFPSIILRDKEKADYYNALRDYDNQAKTKSMDKILALAIKESMHKRLAYLQGKQVIKLADYAKKSKKSSSAITNAAKRQTIEAFREKGVWKIGI